MVKYRIKNYPRPQFVRNSYLSLNGEWDFRFDEDDEGLKSGWKNGFCGKKIQVPFSYESKKSGIGLEKMITTVWYCRQVDFSALCGKENGSEDTKRVLLNFEGSDYKTEVWINGIFIGEHQGGYTRFSFDITDALNKFEGTVVLRIQDDFSTNHPRGKQRWLDKNYDCWYLQTTGLWKDVWAEYVPILHLESIHMTPAFDKDSVDLEYFVPGIKKNGIVEIETTVYFENEIIAAGRDRLNGERLIKEVSLISNNEKWKVKHWSPEEPNLYDLSVRLYENGALKDEIGSYFGMRKITANGGKIQLNHEECYLKMILDQGYWEDTNLTLPDENALINDLDKIKAYGFNGIRMHQKIESELFYYWADVKGLLVWCEAPSCYEFDETSILNFTYEWIDIVRQLYNHPSIISWVLFNESWGIPHVLDDKKSQNFTESMYFLTKSLDDNRLVISNDGWEHTHSDIVTLHDYAAKGEELAEHLSNMHENNTSVNGIRYAFAKGFKYSGQPVILSEFGGIAYKKDRDGWGYGKAVENEADFLKRMKLLYDAIKTDDKLSGFCYTQLTDVQQEQNGLMDMKHIEKTESDKVQKIIKGGE